MLNRSTVNKVILLGKIARAPQWHVHNHQRMLCFPVITIETLKRNGLTETHTEYHMIRVPEHLADASRYVKDAVVYVQGRVQTTPFVDEQKVRHYRAEIIANSIDLIDLELLKNTVV